MQLVADGNLATLGDWLGRLPRDAVAGRWRLELARAWVLVLTNRLDEAVRAQAALRETLAVDPERRFIAAALDAALGAYGDDSARCLALTAHFPPHGDPYHVGAACNIVSLGHLLEGAPAAARDAQTWSRQWDARHASPFSAAYGEALVAWSYFLQGRPDAARALLEPLLLRAEQAGGPLSAPACVAAAFLAPVRYEAGELEAVCELIGPRLDVLGERVVPEASIQALRAFARASAACARPWAADEAMQALRVQSERTGAARLAIVAQAEEIRARLLQAADPAALLPLQEALETALPRVYGARTHGSAAAARRVVVASRARLEAALGRPQAALEARRALHAELLACGWRLPALAVQADLVTVLGVGAARREAAELLSLARACGGWQSLLDAGVGLAAVLRDLPRPAAPAEAAWLARLLDAMPDTGGAPAPAADSGEALNARGREIARLLGEGLPNKLIARALGLAPDTVKWHLKNLYRKLGVSSRYQVVQRVRDAR